MTCYATKVAKQNALVEWIMGDYQPYWAENCKNIERIY